MFHGIECRMYASATCISGSLLTFWQTIGRQYCNTFGDVRKFYVRFAFLSTQFFIHTKCILPVLFSTAKSHPRTHNCSTAKFPSTSGAVACHILHSAISSFNISTNTSICVQMFAISLSHSRFTQNQQNQTY